MTEPKPLQPVDVTYSNIITYVGTQIDDHTKVAKLMIVDSLLQELRRQRKEIATSI